MIKLLRKELLLITALFIYFLVFSTKAYASVPELELEVKTVIENTNEVASEIASREFTYNVSRVVNMYRIQNNTALIPNRNNQTETFEWRHNQTTKINLRSVGGITRYDLLIFSNSASTSANLSLSRIEYTSNTGPYLYDDDGRARLPIEPFNWANIASYTGGKVGVTLYFRYNPDIGEVATGFKPIVHYSKQIDYLGDGEENLDTTQRGDNDYRLYLSVSTQEPEIIKDKDIIFLIDLSNSMTQKLGTGTRFDKLKSVLKRTVETLSQNPNNKISIVGFGTNSQIYISKSSNKERLLGVVNDMQLFTGFDSGTNYYSALKSATNIVRELVDPQRETVVFLLTDGEPTAAVPAADAIGYTLHNTIGTIYAAYAAESFIEVDRFYSIFIGNSGGSASSLQTITQRIPTSLEKYMVHVNSAEQLENTFDRFLSKIDGNLYEVKIEDQLSEYVNYAGRSKVVKILKGQTQRLVHGKNYTLDYDNIQKKIKLNLKEVAEGGAKYLLSFDVKASDSALIQYSRDNAYPHIGDSNTDYSSNMTSSGKRGFYSNSNAVLNYKFDGGVAEQKIYPKPVIQVVKPPAIPVKIEAKKELKGKVLKDDMFEFELYSEDSSGIKNIVSTAKNKADGTILFENINTLLPGRFTYKMREVIPALVEPGMRYDESIFEVDVSVAWENGQLKVVDTVYRIEPIFKNEYIPEPVIINLEAKKLLTGRALKNEEFSFNLSYKGKIIDTKQNDAAGDIKFSPIILDKTGVYKYIMREVVPVPVDTHIMYDVYPRYIDVEVTDAGGRLEADIRYTNDNTFNNEFKHKPVDAVIKLKKVLTGMRLVGGAFSFELRDMQSGETTVVGNLPNGDILYPGITFSAPGQYRYEVKELIPDVPDEYMSYDSEKIIRINISVSDDGTGDLIADIDYSEEPVFYNSYKIRGGIW